jgi:LmbE family N-acetylglucosaminyl deacetylase
MRIAKQIIFILAAVVVMQCSTNPETKPTDNSPKTLLAIFAHPDDEATVSPVLARYAAEGVKVYLAIATDGRLGYTEHAKIPKGDSLAAVRKLELQCAAEKLGINPPFMFGLEDQLKMGEGMGAFNTQMDSLRKGVRKLFLELKPDVVLTWNASGWTGHHDHRLVSAVVTEVFESQKWDKPSQLYYSAIPTGNLPEGAALQLATVDKSFLTITITVSEADYAKSKESWLCHKSQYTPEMIEGMHQMIKGSVQNTWYFRPHSGTTGPKQTLF